MADWTPNFDWVTPDIAVGGAFPRQRIAELKARHRIGAVIDLRSEACDDAETLTAHGIRFLHLPTEDHHPPDLTAIRRGLGFVSEQKARGTRVLIHCEHGIGRSAILALCVLVETGMEPLAALVLIKDRRAVVSPSLAQHRGWTAWLEASGRAPLDFDAFAAVAYRRLADA